MLIKQEASGKDDEYVFATILIKLIDRQEEQVELAVVGKDEYKFREAFQHILISPSHWGKLNEKQRLSALRKIHTVAAEDRTNKDCNLARFRTRRKSEPSSFLRKPEWTGSHAMSSLIS